MFVFRTGIAVKDDLLKAELLTVSKLHATKKVFRVDELAEEAGHRVIRLPPYHCHLNPIELLWAYEKVCNVNL